MKFLERIFFTVIIVIAILNSNLSAQTGSVLTFSEIMFNPSETNGEFVEVYNTSTTETVDLTNYKFKYYTSSNNNIIALSGGMQLGPGKFAVILQGNYDYTNGTYKTLIHADAIVLKISTNNFGSSGMANTTSRDVYLINATGQTIDTYTYSADNSIGISDEKYILGKDNSESNWKNSLRTNGTPGAKNSVSPLDFDLRATFIGIIPSVLKAEDSVFVTVNVKNTGKLSASNFSVDLFNDANNDSIGQASESIFNGNYTNLASGDSLIIQKVIYIATIGDYYFLANATFSQDENNANNKSFLKFTAIENPALPGEIVVNEIMYAPTNDEPEWVEIFNRTNRAINLKGWKIGDNTSLVTISTSDFILNSGEYLVIGSDATISNFYQVPFRLLIKSLPSLSNSGDDVIMKNNLNVTIDSVKYLPSWGGNTGSKSLERIRSDGASIDPANWKTSQSKFRATPGMINSVSAKNSDLSIKNFTSVFKYAEVGKSFSLKVVVENLGITSAANFSVKIYNDQNFDNVEQTNELIGETAGMVITTGNTAAFDFSVTNIISGQNQFIAGIDFTSDENLDNNNAVLKVNGVVINEHKGDLFVNEIMYAPSSPEQEWIEIFNASAKQINLKGYKVANHTDTTKVINADLILQPEEYFVLAKDTLNFAKYPKVPQLLLTTFPTLNNTKDKIILLDSLNRAIDSLEYKSFWGGSGGKSLEKIEAANISTDSTNWKTSTNINGATPGFINSVSRKNYDVRLILPSINPKKPIVGETVKINIGMWNPGKKSASFVVKLYEILKDEKKILLKEESASVPPMDDGVFYLSNIEYVINNLSGSRSFEYFADFPLDQDTTNNRIVINVRPGYSPGSVLINEVMYNPVNGEPEWMELYNNSQFDVDLENWSITDVLTTPSKSKILSKDYIFPAKTFLVVSKDFTIKNYHTSIPSKLIISSFANLNNDADGIVLQDSWDVTIDSVRYDISYGGTNGRSLERKSIASSSVDKNNWGSSKDIELSTPGRINTITPKKYDLTISAITTTPQYPDINEDVKLNAKIVNYGSERADAFMVKFYLKTGNIISFFSDGTGTNLSSKDSVWVVSNSYLKLNENKTILCKVIFSSDEDTLNNSFVVDIFLGSKRNVVLISEVMYNPLSGESEWVEIVNASNELVNLKNWTISDELPSPTKATITNKDIILNPSEFAVLTQDSLHYQYVPPKKFFQAKFGTLSSSDGILLYDLRGAVIDSLKYNSSWGGAKGFSLERFSFSNATNDSLNWATTLNLDGGTPGIINSVVNAPKYSSGSIAVNEIMYDPAVDNSEYLEFYNTTEDSIQIGGMEVKIGSSYKFKLATSFLKLPPKDYFVLAADSSIFKNYLWLKNESKTRVAGSSSFGLSNEGALIVLKDMRGDTLDSLFYSPAWHNKNIITTKNKSLERLNPVLNSNNKSNWNTSVNEAGGSPGKQNSIFTQNPVHESKVTISPNPFSPDNDGFEDFTIINFDLAQALAQVRIKVFDSQGRLVRTLAENRPSASKNSIIFDGLDESGRPLRIGIYILLIETVTDSGAAETIKAPIVVARKL